ncbi:MAG: C40 family peptidase [Saprospiraceae bacterium]|nr:C40 family peptidase [Saprospiraceae bacterium]
MVGICKIALASLRKLPDHKAQLISQVLYGEKVHVISQRNKHWWRVVCDWDQTVGWVDPKQFEFNHFKFPQLLETESQSFALEHFHGITTEQKTVPIMLGSNLYSCDGLNVKMPTGKFQYTGQHVDLEQSKHSRKLLLNISRRFLHAPYFEGGRSITGTDASGFIQIVFKMIGINIPRYPEEISVLGDDIGFYNEAVPGDIAFFGKGNKDISHIGVIIEDGLILHAYGRVKADRLDQQGIYDLDEKRYTFKLRSIRRHFPLNN